MRFRDLVKTAIFGLTHLLVLRSLQIFSDEHTAFFNLMCLGGIARLYTCLSAPPTTGRIVSCPSSFPPGQISSSVFSQRSFFPKPRGRATPLGAAAAGGGKGGGEGGGGGKRAPGTPACGKLRKYKRERSIK